MENAPRQGGKATAILKTVIFTILVPGSATVLIPYLLLSSGAGPHRCEIGPLGLAGLGSLPLAAYAGLLWLAFHLFVVSYEEPFLRKKFGSAYDEYCNHVPRWVPK